MLYGLPLEAELVKFQQRIEVKSSSEQLGFDWLFFMSLLDYLLPRFRMLSHLVVRLSCYVISFLDTGLRV